MSGGNGYEFTPLCPPDRVLVSEKLLAFINEFEPLIHRGFGEEIPGSRAERLARGSFPSDSQGPFAGRNAIETALFAALAGTDHVRLLAHAILREDAAFSLATLTRGAVESFARSMWLIESDEDEEVILRWLSGLARELSYDANESPTKPLGELRGRATTFIEAREGILDDIEKLSGSRSPRPVKYGELAASLINRSKSDGRAVYSQLSSVAHGESLGHHGFVSVDVDDQLGEKYVVSLHEMWGASYATQAFAASSVLSRELLKLLGIVVPSGGSFAVAHDDAAHSLAMLLARVQHNAS